MSARAGLPAPGLSARPPTPLADLVREAAATAPGSIAVEAGDRAVTYWDLVGSADRLADELRGSGAGTVAVTGPRGIGFVVAVLAAATAPVRLVTIDPGLPAARRVSMVKAAAVDLVLATDEVSAAEVASLNLLAAKEKGATGTAEGASRVPVCRLSPDGLSAAGPLPAVGPAAGTATYVCFTSGTRGAAKAVLGRQSGVAHFARWQRVRFLAGPGDRFAQLAAPSFDDFLRDVFMPLGAGATLCIAPADVTVRPGGVAEWLSEAGITAVHTAPSLAARWLTASGPKAPWPGLRLSFFAGGPLSDTMVSRWRERFPGTRVINLYGPAETTLAKFCHEVGEPVPGIQPVGRPLPETDLRLVDGEVWIRTPHRTDGYLDDPRETLRRFVREGGEVWYRTGDLGQLDDLGQLHLRGRLSGRLPAAQAPSVFRRIDEWMAERMDQRPLGPTGEIDRSALPGRLESSESEPFEAMRPGDATGGQPPIPRRPAVPTTGLSPQQRSYRAVFLPRGNRTWATMPALFTLPDGTEAAAVERALAEVVRRHDSLRAWFTADGDGKLRQHFAGSVEFAVKTVDLEHLQRERQAERLEQLRTEEAATPIPTGVPPLFRARVIRHGGGRSTLLWNVHRMISDEFSQNLLRAELEVLLGGGTAEDLPPLPVSYRDYVAWRAEGENSGALTAHRAHWQDVFDGGYERPLLPIRHIAGQPARGIGYQFPIPPDLATAVDRFSRAEGVTAFSVYFAAYFLMAHELYGRDDLVVVTPAAGRTRPEVAHLIGNFVSLVGIRHRAGEEISFADLAGRIERRTVRGLEHQDYQYDQVLADIGAESDDDRFPLTTAAISRTDLPSGRADTLRRATFRDLGHEVKFDLLGYLRRSGDAAAFDLHTRRSLMDEADLRALRENFLGLLGIHVAGTAEIPAPRRPHPVP